MLWFAGTTPIDPSARHEVVEEYNNPMSVVDGTGDPPTTKKKQKKSKKLKKKVPKDGTSDRAKKEFDDEFENPLGDTSPLSPTFDVEAPAKGGSDSKRVK
eukprot:COSAG02_NODE_26001_length_643_cov_1.409926_1_plen_99_part_01